MSEAPKSKSKLLRNILYLLYMEKGGKDEDFQQYYDVVMDKIIDQFRSKLSDVGDTSVVEEVPDEPLPPEPQGDPEPELPPEEPEPEEVVAPKEELTEKEMLRDIKEAAQVVGVYKAMHVYRDVTGKVSLNGQTRDGLRAIRARMNKLALEVTNEQAEQADKSVPSAVDTLTGIFGEGVEEVK